MTGTAASDVKTCILCDHPIEKHRPACTVLLKTYDPDRTRPFRNRRYSPEYEAYMKEKRDKIVTKPLRRESAVQFQRCSCDGLPDMTAAAAATAIDGDLCNSCGHPESDHIPGDGYGPPRFCRARADLLGREFGPGNHCGECRGYRPKRETPSLLPPTARFRNPNEII